jgi:hypothetical protein
LRGGVEVRGFAGKCENKKAEYHWSKEDLKKWMQTS